jgi:intein/homing endonuclease
LKDFYFQQYIESYTDSNSQSKELIYYVLRYKWLNGKLLDLSNPIDEFIKHNNFTATALKYSYIYVISHKDVKKWLDDSRLAKAAREYELPYKFIVKVGNTYDEIVKEIEVTKKIMYDLSTKTALVLHPLFTGGALL